VHHHFDEPRPLLLDPGRVAVLATDDDVLADAGLAVERDLPVPGWRLAAVPAAERTPAGAAARVDALAADARVAFTSPVFLDDRGGPLVIGRDVLVRFEPHVPVAADEAVVASEGAVVERGFGGMAGAYRVRPDTRDGRDVLAAANRLAVRPDVRFAEPDMLFTGMGGGFIPNEPAFDSCWGLHNVGQDGGTADMDMDAPEAWDLTIGDPGVKVVVIDSGVQQDHPDLNQVGGGDFTSEGPGDGGPVNACDDHGTAVAGCVSAVIDNGLGTVGVAPGCRSASARTFITDTASCNTWSSFSSWTVDALAWAQSIGAKVTCNSNMYGFTSSAIDDKYDETRTAGLVHFACAGNTVGLPVAYPASLPTVNAVTAVDRNGDLYASATTGAGLAYTAPGVEIFTTDRTGPAGYVAGDYVLRDGCSFATPYAAGVAALLFSYDPALTPDGAEAALQAGATDLGAPGYDTSYGWGFVNAEEALEFVFPSPVNNACSSATLIADGAFPFDTENATTDGPDETAACGADAGSDVWFRHFSACEGDLTVTLDDASFDAVVVVYGTGCPSDPGEALGCLATSGGTTLEVPITPGFHRIRVGGVADAEGTGTLQVACVAAPACPGDCADGGDGAVGAEDLLRVLAQWTAGSTPGVECDVDDGSGAGTGDGVTDVSDLLYVLAHWGPCS
jgi:subtilisin family serine protease